MNIIHSILFVAKKNIFSRPRPKTCLANSTEETNQTSLQPAKTSSLNQAQAPSTMAGTTPPLHLHHVMKPELVINRLHIFLHATALLALLYYRATTLLHIITTNETPFLPYLLICISEIILTFQWILDRAYRWRPVTRTVYPERLHQDHHDDHNFPAIDVLICTADPNKEPSLGVMNTVLSAMAMDYQPNKIAVYLQDDGGSLVTLQAMKETWKFSKCWIPFCRKYEVKPRCPEAYFKSGGDEFVDSSEFLAEKKKIQKKYEEFKEVLEKNSVNASSSVSRDHAPIVEIRVSAVISNAPIILVLDCDHYCNDPTAARQAMCYYLDPEISPKLAFVQFPQKFHNISKHDLYDGRLYYYWRKWLGMDGIAGPSISGCNLFLKREALYRTKFITSDVDLNQLRKSFGPSNELIKSIYKNYKPELLTDGKLSGALRKEVQLLASCDYDNQSEWGKEARKISFLQSMCYASGTFDPLFTVPFYGLGIVPQICLLHGVSLYPKVSDPFFLVFAFIFLSSQLKHVQEVMFYGDSFMTSLYELRVWMMKSASCYLYATLNAVLEKIGLHEAHFTLTSKVYDDEETERYQKGIYDFQASPFLIAPMCSLYILNMASFIIGVAGIFWSRKGINEMFAQAFIPLFGMIVNYHVLEGMILRKDRARISPSVSLVSVAIAAFVLCFGSLILIY
ncbi:hypothetical protein BUALT_Bualt14G0108400 [Buddleja alternifolia]|uniref:Cellulose synthase-like protein G2 n=1 Tax=Buddleja alternifolia TaxID=168488 RepID=A0AAV6WIM8_9LAMI|nr:hypothetical protein BUALT_Bualt14G0108400 [Buddleja alternifolia]